MPNATNGNEARDRSGLLRLETALDRISGAVVRRLEQDAARSEALPPAASDDGRTDEARLRLDALILRLRAVLAEGGE